MNVAAFIVAIIGALLNLFQGFIVLPFGEINIVDIILICLQFISEIVNSISAIWGELSSTGEKIFFVIVIMLTLAILFNPFAAIWRGFMALLRKKDAAGELMGCAGLCVLFSVIMFALVEAVKRNAVPEIGALAELTHYIAKSHIPLVWAAIYGVAGMLAYTDGSHVKKQQEQIVKMEEIIEKQNTLLSAQSALQDASGNGAKNYEPIIGVETEALMKRAYIFLEDEDFDEADRYLEQALNQDPENSAAYLGKLMAEKKIRSKEDLAKLPAESLNNEKLFRRALSFADGEEKTWLEELVKQRRGD